MPNHQRKTPTTRRRRRTSTTKRKLRKGGDGSAKQQSRRKSIFTRLASKRRSTAAATPATQTHTKVAPRDREVSPNFCREFHLVFPFDTVPKDKYPIQWNKQNLKICKHYKESLIR